MQSLSEQFAAHGADGRMHRAYLALVWGKPLRPRGVISARLARSQSNRTKIGVTRGEGGRHAVTHYEVLKTFDTDAGPVSLLRLELETGRTHQIRVHLAHIGHPVLGDTTYASDFKTKARQAGRRQRGRLWPRLAGRRCTPPSLASSIRSRADHFALKARYRADMQALLTALQVD